MPLESRAAWSGSTRFIPSSQRRGPRALRGAAPRTPGAERPRARRAAATFPPVERREASTGSALPFRLRWLVLLLGAGLGLRAFGLRAVAYWQLHATATQFGNYAACMVGPTGPQLLRDRPQEFWQLVRRRLVASAADARPFAACAPALSGFAGTERQAAHEAKASDFREYAALRSDQRVARELSELLVSDARVTELLAAAWPLAPADLDDLVRPARHAKVAPHPVEPPHPARGRGLPAADLGYSSVRATDSGLLLVAGQGANARAYRSVDGGITWAEGDVGDPAAAALEGLCSSEDGDARFRVRHSGAQLLVESLRSGAAASSFPFASADSRVLGFACDGGAALAITRDDGESRTAFRVCPHLAPCKSLAVPPPLRRLSPDEVSLSIARIKGVVVIAMARAGIVRVISSRDDGATWTPPVVAYDRGEQGGGATPTHLLSLGSKLVLYAGGRSASDVYPSLSSSDFGASWQGL